MSTVLSLPKKILHSRIFSFLCIKLYTIEKEDRAEETHQGCLFALMNRCSNEHWFLYPQKKPMLMRGYEDFTRSIAKFFTNYT